MTKLKEKKNRNEPLCMGHTIANILCVRHLLQQPKKILSSFLYTFIMVLGD